MMVAQAITNCMWCGSYTAKGILICPHSIYCGYCCQKVCWNCAQRSSKEWCDNMKLKYRQQQGTSVNLSLGIHQMHIDDRTSFKCRNCKFVDAHKCIEYPYMDTNLVMLFASLISPV